MPLSPDILERVNRVAEYHQKSKLTEASVAAAPPLDVANQPKIFRTFADCPKLALPTNVLDMPDYALPLMHAGVSVMAESRQSPKQDLRTLASLLYMAAGQTSTKKTPAGVQYSLRTWPSAGGMYPCEIYVAAFAIEGLPPGLYHFSVREFALRKLRDGLGTLRLLTRGRPDLDFVTDSPAAFLVSTIYCRSSWKYRKRAYRIALEDAGHLTQNLVSAATGLGMQTMTRLRLPETVTRELIGLPFDAAFGDAESVQSMVVWTDRATAAPQATDEFAPPPEMPLIPRQPLANEIAPYGSILTAHWDCVAPGVPPRDIRSPLTELTPVSEKIPVAEVPGQADPQGGESMRKTLLARRSPMEFLRQSISRDQFLTLNTLGFRSGTFHPIVPGGSHVGLVRPIWIVHDVNGFDEGIWSYNPATDAYRMIQPGDYRMEARYIALNQDVCGNASAVCVMVSNLRKLMGEAGPDAYRLANLEVGIIAQRMSLAASAMGMACCGVGSFCDEDLRKFLGLDKTGWEILHLVATGDVEGDGSTTVLPNQRP